MRKYINRMTPVHWAGLAVWLLGWYAAARTLFGH